ncbi:MAG: zf-HC2 domain-containing protein [Verrucomicrobiota bacterium]
MQSLKQRWIVWVWNHTPTCAEMSRLASQSLERPLSLKMRLKMWLHFLICVWCERYQKHLKFLHRAAPQFGEQVEAASSRGLSVEAKQRIKARLHEIHKH